MIPDFTNFVRFQDKRFLLFLYIVLLIILGFYWKNAGYSLTSADAGYISVILAITLFTLIQELKAYWAYSYVINRINLDVLQNKTCSRITLFISRPLIVSVCSVLVFWLIAQGCLLLSVSGYSIIILYLVTPLFIYLVFRAVREIYIRQVLTTMTGSVQFRHLYQYAGVYIVLNTVVSTLSIAPLRINPDFSLSGGYFTARLMVAMLILCGVVIAINLAFSRVSKRYVFLGRIFLNEITFFFSTGIPLGRFSQQPFLIRLVLLFIFQTGWIFLISFTLDFLTLNVGFVGYFLLCYLPCLAYHFLHIYWSWHTEFLMSCDMYFRYDAFTKRKNRGQ